MSCAKKGLKAPKTKFADPPELCVFGNWKITADLKTIIPPATGTVQFQGGRCNVNSAVCQQNKCVGNCCEPSGKCPTASCIANGLGLEERK
jgi:hypothetical protein